MGDLPAWLQFFLAALSGLIIGVGASIRWLWGLSDRVALLEHKMGTKSVSDQIQEDRHNNIYPMIQVKVIDPHEKLEEEVKHQGQNIAILLDRHRIEQLVGETVSLIRKIVEPKNS